MRILLHEGHEHTEAAASTAGTETAIVVLLAILLVAGLSMYAVKRFA